MAGNPNITDEWIDQKSTNLDDGVTANNSSLFFTCGIRSPGANRVEQSKSRAGTGNSSLHGLRCLNAGRNIVEILQLRAELVQAHLENQNITRTVNNIIGDITAKECQAMIFANVAER